MPRDATIYSAQGHINVQSQSGVDLPTIAHWLGHASVNTTNRYATIDLEMKRKALARAQPPSAPACCPSPKLRQTRLTMTCTYATGQESADSKSGGSAVRSVRRRAVPEGGAPGVNGRTA